MRSDATIATLLVPLWFSATWWTFLVLDAIHFAEALVDWVWLPRMEPTLFVPGVDPAGRDVTPPDWTIMAFRVDFSAGATSRRIPLRDRCVRGGCDACQSLN